MSSDLISGASIIPSLLIISEYTRFDIHYTSVHQTLAIEFDKFLIKLFYSEYCIIFFYLPLFYNIYIFVYFKTVLFPLKDYFFTNYVYKILIFSKNIFNEGSSLDYKWRRGNIGRFSVVCVCRTTAQTVALCTKWTTLITSERNNTYRLWMALFFYEMSKTKKITI